MPMRAVRASAAAYRAGSGHAGAHISRNLLVWIAGCAAVVVVAILIGWGTVAAVAAMLGGILIMMKAEEGRGTITDEEEDIPPGAPTAEGYVPPGASGRA